MSSFGWCLQPLLHYNRFDNLIIMTCTIFCTSRKLLFTLKMGHGISPGKQFMISKLDNNKSRK